MTNIFKAYDIRGIYGENIDKDVAYKLGRSFVIFLKKRHPKIAIGRDNRLSSPELFQYLKKGIIDQGGIVIDIGLSTTPMLYFGSCFLKTDGGIMITASHNPKEYNGFKLVSKNAMPIGENSGLKEIEKIYNSLDNKLKKGGESIKKNILKEYIKFIEQGFNLKDFDFKIGIDTANAVPGILVDKIKTNLKIYHINKELDPEFKSHEPDPLQKKNLKQLQNLIKEKKLDLGIAFDGDGDRVVFLDENGKVIPSDIILALIADVLGKKVLYDLRCSNIISEIMGDKAYMSRVGHSFIKKTMKEKNLYLGGEYSGHFYLNDKYCFEAPFFFLFNVLEQMKLSSKKLSELIKPYQKYYHSGEINFKVENKDKVIKGIEENYKEGKKTKIDGIRIDFEDFWF
ncbi:MAG: phosphomannomutase/phosphoglucomutase, partial [Candidatus Pacebacteria bacterium]|nr:phosphomannomutase/phosphoglucomutase [Candidatus Paceibacterota bacterium]